MLVANKEKTLYAWLMISPFWVNFFPDKIGGLYAKGERGTSNSSNYFAKKNVLSRILRLPNRDIIKNGLFLPKNRTILQSEYFQYFASKFCL